MQWQNPFPLSRLRSRAMAAVVVCGLAAWIYWPALKGGLLWDDNAHVTRVELRSLHGLWRIWTDVRATQQYYPVVHSAFWVEHRLWGDWTLPYHALNVVLHAGASLLFVLALKRLWAAGRARGRGVPEGAEWLAGLIFAVHPVCVESVAWISEQKNTLSLVFYLLGGLLYLNFDQRRKASDYWAALGLYLLALGTKSVTATLPAALLVMLWWQKGRLSWRRDVAPLAPWLLLGMSAGLVTASVEHNLLGAAGSEFDLKAWERVMLAGRVVWFYLGKLFWPVNLAFIYPHWDVAASAARWIGWLAGAAAVTAGLWWLRARSRGPLAGWLFFTGSLFPALGFLNAYPFRYSYVADHFQYLASLGVIALAAAGAAATLQSAGPGVRAAGRALCAALAVALAILAHRQARNYRNAVTLYRATLASNPACWMAHNNLGIQLAQSPGGEAEAIVHYREALAIDPAVAEIHYNLADSLARLPGGLPEAIGQYEEALRLKPDYAEAHNNLAIQLAKIPGRLPEAIAHYEAALRLEPSNAEAHNNLAAELANLPGRAPEAIAHFEAALSIEPGLAEAHLNLANLLAGIPGREPEALAHYEAALKIDPANAQAHNNLAVELTGLPGRMPDAIAHFEAALRIKPDFEDAHLNLANVLAAIPGRAAEAIAHYQAALRLAPGDVEARRNLQLLLERESPGTR